MIVQSSSDAQSQAMAQFFTHYPYFFPLFFIALWIFVSGSLGWLSGWRSLARKYRDESHSLDSAEAQSFRRVSGSMGSVMPVNFGRCLKIAVFETGILISVSILFRFGQPPLFIPWTDVELVEKKQILFVKKARITVKNSWPRISLLGKAGQAVQNKFAQKYPSKIPQAEEAVF